MSKLDNLYSILLKTALGIILFQATFRIWKIEDGGLIYWVLPAVSLFWLILILIEAFKIQKDKKWKDEKVTDEREMINKYKAGYVAFWVSIFFLTGLFFFYGTFGFTIFLPINALAFVILLNTLIYFAVKLYYLFYK
ncbi:hypothetical protein GJU40_16240 [Bacillus lacus]|uniref:DUF2178 domain-containing protein n=1 Tax=Metabacillus lacus TaxID=1983721 RepID=A0A7X2J1N4_9BACI|nr:hypothetical protein [Metabacillus lacus]MRX73691.1 hypothetical protein [Metabacillus lacus]